MKSPRRGFSAELERRLKELYDALHISPGQLESLTGIIERRWWEEGYRLSDGAIAAARRALATSNVVAEQIEVLIYGGVCREYFEPATAARVASVLGVGAETTVYDISNACLGVLNGMVEIANRIELGQIRAGDGRLVRDGARDQRDRDRPDDAGQEHGLFQAVAGDPDRRLGRGGSLVDGRLFLRRERPKASGWRHSHGSVSSMTCADGGSSRPVRARGINYAHFTATDATAVLTNGVELGPATWQAFLRRARLGSRPG